MAAIPSHCYIHRERRWIDSTYDQPTTIYNDSYVDIYYSVSPPSRRDPPPTKKQKQAIRAKELLRESQRIVIKDYRKPMASKGFVPLIRMRNK